MARCKLCMLTAVHGAENIVALFFYLFIFFLPPPTCEVPSLKLKEGVNRGDAQAMLDTSVCLELALVGPAPCRR